MNINSARLFYYVVQNNGFSAAARKLNISKSSLSKGVKQLEEELNSTLLKRESKKISLTRPGEKLYFLMHEMLGDIERYQYTQSVNNTLKIGIVGTYTTWAQVLTLDYFKQNFWNIIFSYDESVEESINRIHLGIIDGIVSGMEGLIKSDLKRVCLKRHRFLLVGSKNFDSAKEYKIFVPQISRINKELIEELLKKFTLTPEETLHIRYDYFDMLENIILTNNLAMIIEDYAQVEIERGDIIILNELEQFDSYFFYGDNVSKEIVKVLEKRISPSETFPK